VSGCHQDVGRGEGEPEGREGDGVAPVDGVGVCGRPLGFDNFTPHGGARDAK
jgi:hypothetical protein